MRFKNYAAAVAVVLACFCVANAQAQSGSQVGNFPNAAPLNGSERILAAQNTATVNLTPAQIGQYLGISSSLTFPLAVNLGGTGANSTNGAILNLLPPLAANFCLAANSNATALVWVSCGSGGGTPGGTSGQVQYNNSGTFGGFTLSGDATLNPTTGVATVAKTNGVAFTPWATINYPTLVSGECLSNNGTTLAWIPCNQGFGTVTTVSVASANGLSGTVANATTTPAITLAPSFTGIAYANGAGFAPAVAGNFPTLNQSTTGNAATATALAATPAQCGGSQFATGITAAGVANCATPTGSGNVSNSGTPTQFQIPVWASATTILGVGPGVAGQALISGGPAANPSYSSSLADVTSVNGTTIPAAATLLVNGGPLGTPSSGTATNLTGLPTTGLTGTLQAAQEPAHTGDVTNTAGSLATTVKGINGTTLSALGTGILKNTTTTGVPSIAVAADFPTLNQNTTGNAATASSVATTGLTGTLQAAQMPALTGDVTNSSGSLATTVGKVNGGTLPISASALATNSLGQIITGSAGGGGTVTTTGSPVSGNLSKFSGATAITNGDLSGDVTTSGTLAATVVKVNGAAVPVSASVLGSNGSGQLVADTTTGTGNAVLATSPTLITPALGTPSALVLTNATGLPNASVIGLGTFATANAATPPAIGGTTPAAGTFSSLKDTGITGSTQCLHVDTTGAVTGTGSDCGAGGSTAFSGLTSGTNTAMAGVVGTGASLSTSGTGTIAATNTTGVNGAAVPASAAVLASNVSNQIIAATTTGSGSAVLATSPTLVTPVLGTPTSGTLTNATGLPIATGVSGLGAGVATFLATPSSANLATAVTGETGSGALVFGTSPTLTTPALGTPSALVLTNATSLPCAATPALTGDATSSAGTCATSVVKINGGAVPASAALVATNSSSQPTAVTLAQTLAINSGALGTTVPNRTVTTSPTVASTDMGGIIFLNVTGGGTTTIPAISSTVFAAGMSLTLTNYSASTAAISTTPTINAGAGCVSGTGIPTGDTWELTSNGTTIDCNQTVKAGGGTVTSVAATVPAFLSISGSPVTASGTLAIGLSGTALPAANGGTACAGLTGTASSTTFLRGDCSWNTPSGGGSADIQLFTTPGTATWTKPGSGSTTQVMCLGGGGGGASGNVEPSGTEATGAGGGGGGSFIEMNFPTASLGATVTVTVGAGGTGGTAVASTGPGNAGGAGGNSTFGTLLTAWHGGNAPAPTTGTASNGGGGGGITAAGNAQFEGDSCGVNGGNAGGGQNPSCIAGGASGGGSSATGGSGNTGGPSLLGGAGGASGGGISTGAIASAGAAGGKAGTSAGGAAGNNPGTAPTNYGAGGGGGGGGGSTTTNGVSGGAGALGAGGGGGGAALNGVGSSGAGGAGGGGMCVAITR